MRVNRHAEILLIACPVSKAGSVHVQYKVFWVDKSLRAAFSVLSSPFVYYSATSSEQIRVVVPVGLKYQQHLLLAPTPVHYVSAVHVVITASTTP